jgi:hypothetical protein
MELFHLSVFGRFQRGNDCKTYFYTDTANTPDFKHNAYNLRWQSRCWEMEYIHSFSHVGNRRNRHVTTSLRIEINWKRKKKIYIYEKLPKETQYAFSYERVVGCVCVTDKCMDMYVFW